ncbi:membrane-binding protein [Pontibacter sp. BT213]|uniref:Membrane-binding protein n=1 Tax=Pontibacter fetidus TaxID=2700082 RepID=A0A6B2H0E8_9BACT|nr:membrane-binding protein [Pontibacter fetidus]
MKKTTILLSLLVAPLLGAQATTSIAATNTTSTATTVGARDIVKEIIDVVGLKPRFELQAANIENAAAVIYNGRRYILYNEDFMAAINNAVHTDWAGVSILAHEIGHHLNGHTLSRAGSNPADELEADEFSGFVLRKMGASLAEAQAAINLLSEEHTSATHPGRNYRLASISKGWRNADSQLMASAQGQQPARTEITPRTATRQQPQAQRVSESRYVLSRVHFSSAPDEEFYLTNSLQLVHNTGNGLKVIGKLTKTNNSNYPFYLDSEYLEPLFVTAKGMVVNQQGQRVGYLT